MPKFRYNLATLLVCSFILALNPLAHADDLNEISQHIKSTPDEIAKGKTVFMTNCMSCHGSEGKGDGPASAAFNPKPRNFTAEPFKQGGSPSAVFYTITHGLNSMPGFASLSVADRLAVVHFLLSLSPSKANDTPESLAKIGLGPDFKPLAGFKGDNKTELPLDFIIERMAQDGDVNKLDYKKIVADMKAQKEQEAKPQQVTTTTTPNLEKGKALFESCKTCHGNAGEGSFLAKAPPLAGQSTDYLITQLHHFQKGIRGAHPNDVDGLRMRPMSRVLRDEQDVINVVNYIHSLKPTAPINTMPAGNPQKGQAAFSTCLACHGPDAKGVAAMKAPSLRYLPDWYIAQQINNFKQGYRGVDTRDTMGGQMRGMSMSVPNQQAVQDIVSYIQTLK